MNNYDIESRMSNQEQNQKRVEERLKIHEQLITIKAEIKELQGRFLRNEKRRSCRYCIGYSKDNFIGNNRLYYCTCIIIGKEINFRKNLFLYYLGNEIKVSDY